jgi:hypothetical protein
MKEYIRLVDVTEGGTIRNKSASEPYPTITCPFAISNLTDIDDGGIEIIKKVPCTIDCACFVEENEGNHSALFCGMSKTKIGILDDK